MANTFHGPLDAHTAILAPQCMSGGTMNFNYGSDRPDPDFVDRPEILGWLRGKCARAGTRAALVGLGGVGKSQLAIQFAHSIHDANPQTFVFWVHASSRTQFEEAYKDIADRLQLPERNDPKANVLKLVSNWLRDKANGQWFMVLDNVDREDTFFQSRKHTRDEANTDLQTSLAAYLPQINGSILVTSRNQDAAVRLVGSRNRIKEVLAMDGAEGLQLLRNKLCQSPLEESAVQLLVALGHIPLTITQAAAYINRRVGMSVTKYLNDFHRNSKNRERLLDWDPDDLRRDKSASNSTLTTWQMSFEQIRQERPSAAGLLSLMSFFNPQGIPGWILRKFRKTSAEAAASDNSDDYEDDEDLDSEFDEDLDILRAYSLISATAENNTYEMHPLVQFCMRAWLSSFDKFDQWHHRFVVLMAQELDYEKRPSFAKLSQLFPHVEPLFDSKQTKETYTAWTNILKGSMVYLVHRGRATTAQQVLEKAMSVTENTLGFNNDTTLKLASCLIGVLETNDCLREAEQLGQRMLQEYKKLGKRNSYIMSIMEDLAIVMRRQGRYDESEKLVQEIIGAHKGECDPSIIGVLAIMLQRLGQLEEAEKLFRQAIEGCKEQLGERHPKTLQLTSDLAGVLSKQRQWLEAESFLRQTLEAKKEQLGERPLDTLLVIKNLATALENQDRHIEAEKLYWEAIEGFKELGGYDVYTFAAMAQLFTMLRAQGRYEEAAKLGRQVLNGFKNMEFEHPTRASVSHILAIVLQDLGQYAEAVEMYQQVCTGYTAQFGPQDPRTIRFYEKLEALQNQIQEAGSCEGTVSTSSNRTFPQSNDLQG